MPTSLELIELEAALRDQLSAESSVLESRNYFNGIQEIYLTTRQREYLGLHDDNDFRLNVCRTIVTSLANELNLVGFDTNEQGDSRPVAEWANAVYKKNKLLALQDTVHESALSDSETFTIVEWDSVGKYPRIIHNIRWCGDLAEDTLKYGASAIYENGDPAQTLEKVVKQWYESSYNDLGIVKTTKRRTIYYPGKIYRLYWDGGQWRDYDLDGMPAVIDWTINGAPMGVASQHFKNKGIRSEHWDAIPMQDAINKTLVDILAVEDMTGFKSFWGFNIPPTLDGKEPAADGSNLRKIAPGQLNTTTRLPSEASLQEITADDPTPMVNFLTQLILYTAQMTDTPASKFIATGAVASAETLKEQDKQLQRKADDRRDLFGDGWTQVINMARRVNNKYDPANKIDETVDIIPIWSNAKSLSEIAEKRTTINIPIEQAWTEAGYTPAQIDKMRSMPSYKLQFESQLWQGATAATQNIPLETYLRRAGVTDDEIKAIKTDIEGQSGIPSTGL